MKLHRLVELVARPSLVRCSSVRLEATYIWATEMTRAISATGCKRLRLSCLSCYVEQSHLLLVQTIACSHSLRETVT